MSADYKPCPVCHDTGETQRYGICDCAAPGCTAALERAALDAYIESLPAMSPYDERWHAYQFALGRRVQTQ